MARIVTPVGALDQAAFACGVPEFLKVALSAFSWCSKGKGTLRLSEAERPVTLPWP